MTILQQGKMIRYVAYITTVDLPIVPLHVGATWQCCKSTATEVRACALHEKGLEWNLECSNLEKILQMESLSLPVVTLYGRPLNKVRRSK